jgi:hypothetical protein
MSLLTLARRVFAQPKSNHAVARAAAEQLENRTLLSAVWASPGSAVIGYGSVIPGGLKLDA